MPTKGNKRAYVMRKKMQKAREKDIREHCGQPFMDSAYELIKEVPTEEEVTDAWIYSLSCGDGWDVVLDDDGFLTVEEIE